MTDLSSHIGGSPFIPGAAEPGGFFGPYRGIVTNTTDPTGQNRIKAVVPQLFGNSSTEVDWALPCQLPGLQAVPTPGKGVWIMFEGGDINYPVYMGMWQAEPSVAPYEVAGAGASAVAQAVAQAETYTNNYVAQELAVFYPAQTYAAGALSIDYTCTGSLATYLTSASLAIGTWEINWQVCAYNPSGVDVCDLQITQGTSTLTFQGPITMESRNDSATTQFAAMNHCTTIAVITAPGTILFQAIGLQSNKPVLKATVPSGGVGGSPTGYVATRIQ